MKSALIIFLVSVACCGVTVNANAATYIAEDDISSQILVDNTNTVGTFDLSSLFTGNVVIDSVAATFSFVDDGDLTYSYTVYDPTTSAYYYAVSGRYYDAPQLLGNALYFYRDENIYNVDVQETVNITLNTHNESVSTTNYFSNSSYTGGGFDGSEFLGSGQDIEWEYYAYFENTYNSGYDGNATSQFNFDQASIDYIMNNQQISFTLNANSGEDILFNSGELNVTYHIEEAVIPEPATLLLLGFGLVGLLKRKLRK